MCVNRKIGPCVCTWLYRTSLLWTLCTSILALITEVSSIQRSFNTLQYYTGRQKGVLIMKVSAIRRFAIERVHCICTYVVTTVQ